MCPTGDSPGLVAAAAEIRVAAGSVEVVVTVAAARLLCFFAVFTWKESLVQGG